MTTTGDPLTTWLLGRACPAWCTRAESHVYSYGAEDDDGSGAFHRLHTSASLGEVSQWGSTLRLEQSETCHAPDASSTLHPMLAILDAPAGYLALGSGIGSAADQLRQLAAILTSAASQLESGVFR